MLVYELRCCFIHKLPHMKPALLRCFRCFLQCRSDPEAAGKGF